MVAALSFSSVVLLPETLATKILSVRAAKMNREAGSVKYATRGDLNRGSTWQFLVRISSGVSVWKLLNLNLTLDRNIPSCDPYDCCALRCCSV
jgi:hypothetical protein